MSTIIRTEKKICLETIDENFIRQTCRLGGKHSIPLKAEFSKFNVKEKFIGRTDTGGGSVTPWDDKYSDLFTKFQDGIEIELNGFDTKVRVWQNGNIQGYYVTSNKCQYGVNSIAWVNLLLEYGFLEYVK